MGIHYAFTDENKAIGHTDSKIAGFLQLVDTPKFLGFGNQGYGDCRLHGPPLSQFCPH
jgi:hypothetical protein